MRSFRFVFSSWHPLIRLYIPQRFHSEPQCRRHMVKVMLTLFCVRSTVSDSLLEAVIKKHIVDLVSSNLAKEGVFQNFDVVVSEA